MVKSISSPFIIDPLFIEGILTLVKLTYHGQIILISQNYKIVQVERKENFNPEEILQKKLGLNLEGFNPKLITNKILQALKNLEFGQIVLVIKKGKLVQIERMQKERFSDLQGLAGDGI
jgi:hypothetical protein